MGSFKVTCAISGLSIQAGDKAVFIPLIPNTKDERNPSLEPSTFLLDQDYLYKPFGLPIRGTYNDYGYLDEIVNDVNTASYEELFATNIQNVVKLICQTNNWASIRDAFFKTYNSKKELFSDECFENREVLLIKLGFKTSTAPRIMFENEKYQKEITVYKHNTLDVWVQILSNNEFIISDSKETTVCHTSLFVNGFLSNIYSISGVMLNYSPEEQEKVCLLNRLSGMFVLEEVYDKLSNRHLDLKSYNFDNKKLHYEDDFIQYVKHIKKELPYGMKREDWEKLNETEIGRKFAQNAFKMFSHSLFNTGLFASIFGENAPFEVMYHKNIEALKEHFIRYMGFHYEMYHVNKIYIPMLNGLQFANLEAEEHLLEISKSILDRRKEVLD